MLKTHLAKLGAAFLGTAMVLSLVAGVAVVPANAQSASDLQAQIQSLLATIQSLQAQLNATTGGSTGGACSYTFTSNLTVGSTGEAVRQLQVALNANPATQVASAGVGSKGNESTYFGGLTKAAVKNFQNHYASEILAPLGLTSGTGYVGVTTRAKLNALCAATTPTTPVTPVTPGTPATSGTGLTVSADVQPANSLAPATAARVPFTKVRLSASTDGDVTVNSITVERRGLAQDVNFVGIDLLDENGTQIGLEKTLDSNHQAILSTPFVIKAGQSKVVTIAGTLAAVATVKAGEVPQLAVVAVNSSATVAGALPIVGAAHTINATLSIGTITNQRGPLDPAGDQTKNVGNTGYTFSSVRITAGSNEKVRINSIRWNQSGSVGSGDLANVVTIVDGVSYPTVVSSDGKYYTASFSPSILLDKGMSSEISIKGDIVSGSGRTIAFDLYRNTDLNVTGDLYGYGITPPTSGTGFAATNPWYDASIVTVSAGTITVSKSNTVAAQNVAINLSNQPLGGFTVEVKGEPVSVASIKFSNSTSTTDITGISLFDENGAIVAGPVDATASLVTFTNTVTFPVGIHTYTVKGKLGTTFSNDDTVQLNTTPSSQWTSVTGQSTGNSITAAPTTAVTSNAMTAKAASVTISVSANPLAQTVVGGSSFIFANYQLDASLSGEDLSMSSLPLEYNIGASTATNLTNCQLYDGATSLTTGSNAKNPTAAASSSAFTFDAPITIAKGTVKTLSLKCDIAGGATGSYKWGYDSASSPTATGKTSGQSATITENDNAGQLMTLSSYGTLAVSLDSSSPSYSVAAAGSSDVVMGVIKFRPTDEAVNLNKIGLALTNTASSSSSDLTQVSVYNGATLVGVATFTGSATTATSTFATPVVLAKDTDTVLTIKANLANIGTSQTGTQGHLIAIDYNSAQGTGASSGTTIEGTGSTAVSGVRMFKSFPTLAIDTLSSLGVADGRLMRFKVTADSHGPIGLSKFKFSISTTSATVSAVNVYAFTDAGYSQAVTGVGTGGQMMDLNQEPNNQDIAVTPYLIIAPQTTGSATTTLQVPAGATRYFEVRATVTGSATSYSVTTTLNGDTSYTNGVRSLGTAASGYGFMSSTTGLTGKYAASADNTRPAFYWSPNATTTSALTANDWTNGFALPGFPSNGLSQTRSN
ncbi:MAG: peptidoglycan-binding domain-containing protein [Candidatus Paceibacterota bacterium]